MTYVLSGIYVYPIKSAAGISVETAKVEARGLHYDRRWMLVDKTGKFLTQRQLPQMAVISVQLEPNCLIVNAPGKETLFISLNLNSQEKTLVQVWDDVCEAIPVGKEAQEWFSDFLKVSCQLVYMPESCGRTVDNSYSVNDNKLVSFADGFPFLLISEASLQDLNKRLINPVPINRFRPNLVVTGCEPYSEDNWHLIRIGSIRFHVVKPCPRCSIVTVNQAKGIQEKEPLQTLAQYRRKNVKVLFGQNLIQADMGTLHLGDAVEIIS